MPVTEMKDHVYKILELVGSSEKSIEDAIQNAITRIKDHSRNEMARSRANKRPYRKRLCPTLSGHFASWIHTRGVALAWKAEVGLRSLYRRRRDCPCRSRIRYRRGAGACRLRPLPVQRPPGLRCLAPATILGPGTRWPASNRIIPC